MFVNSNGYIHFGGDIRNITILLLLSLSFGTITDIDGNVYETVQIGEQLWMAENLKTTKYRDGSEIPNITNNGEWGGLSSGAYGDYNNNPTNSETYGRLYNWYTVDDDRGVCPDGWHVPSDDEYTVLSDFLGGESVAGGKMKEAGYEHWNSPNTGATNESGFTGLPAGIRYNDSYYLSMGNHGYFWSSSEYNSSNVWYRRLSYSSSNVHRSSSGKQSGFSIRCLTYEITTGCTDPEACNYDETATADDGSCVYFDPFIMCDCGETFFDVNGECCSELMMDDCWVCYGDGSICDSALLVPAEFPTIQSAIDAAVEGDSVLVSAGTYVENITWPATNGIKLIGSGEDDCFIDGNEEASVIRFEEDLGGIIDSTTLITGFTIQNGFFGIGGGMNLRYSSPTLTNVTFSGNSAVNGGGMWILGSSPTLTNVTFSGNSALVSGGGMHLVLSSSPTLTDVTFSSNSSASSSGGGMYLNSSSPTLTDVTFSGNTAQIGGGGMYIYSSSPTLTGVTFSNNTANGGGGMYLQSSDPNFTDVTFSSNSVEWYGGGMYISSSNPTLTDVTFSDNTAEDGGGMYLNSSNPTLTNSILWGNSPEEIYFYESGDSTSITITYSDIQGGEAGIVTNDNGAVFWLEGNIDADPLFCDAENGDLTLFETSPCIGAGENGSNMGALDVGCESEDECDLGDVNCDGYLDVLDVVITINIVLVDGYDEIGDMNGDGQLDILDIVILINLILIPDSVIIDIDGNIYETVQIGDQLWMAENLKVTHYNDGSEITHIINDDDWGSYDEGQYGVYDNNPANADIYGNLYNWYVADDDRGVCPDGFHVPSNEEWTILTDFIAPEGIESWGNSIAGGKMKDNINWNGTNESGFTAFPAGFRSTYDGIYYDMGYFGFFWSSSENGSVSAWVQGLRWDEPIVVQGNGDWYYGCSIRCLQD